jgi:hypothetical protein
LSIQARGGSPIADDESRPCWVVREERVPEARRSRSPEPVEPVRQLSTFTSVLVTKENHVGVRADVAFSKIGVTFYFAVGEAF